jgi:hypothetical protein
VFRYFKHVSVKPVQITGEEEAVLKDIAEALVLVDTHLTQWQLTNGQKTIHALSLARGTLLAMSSALTAENYKFARFAAAIHGKPLKELIKAIRCPKTNDASLKDRAKTDRLKLKNCTRFGDFSYF